jgi:hypothetical protein
MRIELEITMNDGAIHRSACTKPPGFWGEPVDSALHRVKIRECLASRLENSQITQVLGFLENLEQLSAQETGQLIALLA